MSKRVPRNFTYALTEKDRQLLRRLDELTKAKPYMPVLMDVAPTLKAYNRVKYQLYKLERGNYVQIHRARGRIRAIEVLMLP